MCGLSQALVALTPATRADEAFASLPSWRFVTLASELIAEP